MGAETKTQFKIVMGRNDLEALMYAYQSATEQLPALMTDETLDLDQLLYDHATEIYDLLQRLHHKPGQNKFTISLKASEARAIYQLWRYAFHLTPYSSEAVRRLCRLVDKQHVPMPV